MTACGRRAAPTAAAQRTVLFFQAAAQGSYAFASAAEWPEASRLLYAATAPFRAKYPAIDLRFWGTTVNPVAEVIAGSGPDIVQLQGGQGAVGAWMDSGLLMDLAPLVHNANLDLTATFATSALDVASRGGSVFAFPYYSETMAMAVNEGLLDQLGVGYPPPQWDYLQWATWSRQVAAALHGRGAAGPPAYATTLATIFGGPVLAGFYLRGWGAGLVDLQDRRRCLLGTPEAIACGEFLYGMVLEGVAQPTQLLPPAFAAGRQVSAVDQQGFVLRDVSALRGLKWRYYPMPTWPHGPYDFTNENLVGINADTRHKDAAWELLQWVCTQPHYQRTLMHLFLYPPALKSLWPEWVAQVHAVAPPLRSKNVEVFQTRMVDNRLVPVYGGSFANADAQALGIVTGYMQQVLSHRLEVRSAFPQAAHDVNALQRAAVGRAHAQSMARAHYPTRGPVIGQVHPGR